MAEKRPDEDETASVAVEPEKAPDAQKSEQKQEVEARERLMRLAAEFDNYKKRVAKDIDGSKSVGKAEIVSKILPSIDEFELALSSSGKTESMKGMALIFSNLMGALKSAGLKEIPVDGSLDPYRHEVLLVKDSDVKEGTILEVVRKGYMLNDIMIRPASVIVSNGRLDGGEISHTDEGEEGND
jgi:molecular chaperone GrpE